MPILRVRASLPLLLFLGASATCVALPLSSSPPVVAQANASFSDVSSDYWARPFIERLAKQDIIAGFPDGTFKPDQAVTRAQFAAIVRKAFDKSAVRNNRDFSDIPAKYWAISAIAKAYTTGFLSGYPDGTFRPEQQIPKVQALISLSSGLQLDPPNNLEKVLSTYRDASDIPDYARKGMAAATQNTLVVNYPNRTFLNPNDTATRADIAAFVYQALVNQKKLPTLPSGSKAVAYIVNNNNNGNGDDGSDNTDNDGGQGNRLVSQGTLLPVKFPGGNNVKLIIAPGETVETSLETSQVIRGPRGGVLIPVGSRIQGSFQPINLNNTQLRGTQYFARLISINGKDYAMNATSDPFIPTAQQALSPGLLQGGFATSAAQILLGGLFGGGANLSGILGGVLGTGNGVAPQPFPDNQNRNVIVVDTSNLILKVQNDFKVALKPGRTLQ